MTMKEDVTSEGKFLTTIHIKIYPFGAYYYPWISNRWKAETKHIYTISCLRVLDNAHLKVMDSFLPLGKYAKGFSLHSSRSTSKKRKIDIDTQTIHSNTDSDLMSKSEILHNYSPISATSIQGAPSDGVVAMGDGSGMNSRNTQEIPNNVPPPSLKTETPQRQAYDDWLTNTFDEDTADALKEQSTTRKVPTNQ